MRKEQRLENEVQEALVRILDHLQGEFDSFIQLPRKQRAGHIFQDVGRLSHLAYPCFSFDLGKLWVSEAARMAMTEAGQEPIDFLRRHGHEDWGDVTSSRWWKNTVALQKGGRLLSSYRTALGVRLRVITHESENVTGIILHEEY